MIQKPTILVTNDDGINAPGIRALIAVMAEIGDVIVVAPDSPQSAMGHAITINNTLYLNKVSAENALVTEYACSGTPVDCVKLAVNEILKKKPEFDPRNYGFSKLTPMLKSLTDILEIDERESDKKGIKHVYVRLRFN